MPDVSCIPSPPQSGTRPERGESSQRSSYLCISDAGPLIPLSNSNKSPVMAIEIMNRGRETKLITARHGGSPALADFHVPPPFGSNILNGVNFRFSSTGHGQGCGRWSVVGGWWEIEALLWQSVESRNCSPTKAEICPWFLIPGSRITTRLRRRGRFVRVAEYSESSFVLSD